MEYNYNKLWKLLIDKKLMKKDLMEKTGITSSTIAKMGKNKAVSMEAVSYTHLDVYKRQGIAQVQAVREPFPGKAGDKSAFADALGTVQDQHGIELHTRLLHPAHGLSLIHIYPCRSARSSP